MNKCLNCLEPVSDRATFCSDRCSKAYRRRTKAGHEPGQNDPKFNPDKPIVSDLKLTRTDRLFAEDAARRGLGLNYYNFSPESFTRECLECGKEFKTNLSMLKTCSPEHRLAIMTPHE